MSALNVVWVAGKGREESCPHTVDSEDMSALMDVYGLQGRVERSAALIQWIVRTCQP